MAKIKFSKEALERAYEKNPAMRAIVEAEGTWEGDATYISEATLRKINPDHPVLKRLEALKSGANPVRIGGVAAPFVPLPRDQWPLWAKALALLAKASDTGLGDVIERTIGPIGGDAFKKWYERIFQKKCDCEARKDKWNLRWPL